MDFRTAIAKANDLLAQSDANQSLLSKDSLSPFFEQEESARGFFVALLTGSWALADNPPQVIVQTLKEHALLAYSLLARNLAMSAATEAAHKRAGDPEKARGSAKVNERTGRLIEAIDDAALWQVLSSMRKTLIGESDSFAEFLARTHYSDDEKLSALASVEQSMARCRPSQNEGPLDLGNPFSDSH